MSQGFTNNAGVSSILQGAGITLTPNPITTIGTVAVSAVNPNITTLQNLSVGIQRSSVTIMDFANNGTDYLRLQSGTASTPGSEISFLAQSSGNQSFKWIAKGTGTYIFQSDGSPTGANYVQFNPNGTG